MCFFSTTIIIILTRQKIITNRQAELVTCRSPIVNLKMSHSERSTHPRPSLADVDTKDNYAYDAPLALSVKTKENVAYEVSKSLTN